MVMLISEPERKNQLLKQLEINGNMEEFLESCYLWTLEPQIWMDIFPLDYPAPPQEWLEYEALDYKAKAKLGEGFLNQFEIKAYLAKRSGVEGSNNSNKHWLKEMREFFSKKEGMVETVKIIDERLGIFISWFKENGVGNDLRKESLRFKVRGQEM